MSKLSDFLKKCKLPILWTMGYLFILWGVMHILFNFEIFDSNNWARVSRLRLHGFSGLTFGIITATAIPLYIATLIIVIRTQKPLLTLPVPTIISNILQKMFPTKTSAPTEVQPTETQKTESERNELQSDKIKQVPPELRAAFIRAFEHPNRIKSPICNVCTVTPGIYPQNNNTPDTNNNMPLPPDFDSDDTFDLPSAPSGPTFKNIDFFGSNTDSDNDSDNTAPNESESEPGLDTYPKTSDPVLTHLIKNNIPFTLRPPDIILTNKHAIATHTDDDFWIMDEPTWFAAGQTRESPIMALIKLAQENNLEPVLYLGSTNIMNLDEKRTEWENNGIKVVTDLSEL